MVATANNISTAESDITSNSNKEDYIPDKDHSPGNVACTDDVCVNVAEEKVDDNDTVHDNAANNDAADQDSSDESDDSDGEGDASEVNVGYTDASEEWEEESLRLVLTDSAVSSVCHKKCFTEDEEETSDVASSPIPPPVFGQPDEQTQVPGSSLYTGPYLQLSLVNQL